MVYDSRNRGMDKPSGADWREHGTSSTSHVLHARERSGSTPQTSPRDDAALQESCGFARAVIRVSLERPARE